MGHSLSHIDLFLNKLSLIFRNYSRALISTYNNTPLRCTYNVANFFYEQAAKLTLLAAFSKKIESYLLQNFRSTTWQFTTIKFLQMFSM